jgi:hypothetical protein
MNKMAKQKDRKQIQFEKQIVKPFEFVLRINDHIICQRYFNIKNYNNDCRESLEMKEMMDDIMGVNQQARLGVIPEFFKWQCMDYTIKENDLPYNSQNKSADKDDKFTLEILKNNVNRLRDKNGDFDLDDLQKESLAIGMFDGKIFHPSVRYEIDVRSIIPDIIVTIQDAMNQKKYTKTYGSERLVRHNRLTSEDYARLETY